MRLVILYDGSVGKEGVFYTCDLSTCGLPQNFWALQWEEWAPNTGHIEFNSSLIPNQEITSLPVWTNCCLEKWQEAYDAEQAAIAQQAARQPLQQGA
jgi:hypothetical protein